MTLPFLILILSKPLHIEIIEPDMEQPETTYLQCGDDIRMIDELFDEINTLGESK